MNEDSGAGSGYWTRQDDPERARQMNMAKPIVLAIAATILISGCATGPYIRSDVFLDPTKVHALFVMPIATEVTLDVNCTVDRQRLTTRLETGRARIREVLARELGRRGYVIAAFAKDFGELREDVPQEPVLRNAVLASVNPGAAVAPVSREELAGVITALLADGKDGARSTAMDRTQRPLVSRSLEARGSYPQETDSILYLFVKSHMAAHGFFGNLTERSTLSVTLKLVSLREQQVIFSASEQFTKADLLNATSLERSVGTVVAEIPVKIGTAGD